MGPGLGLNCLKRLSAVDKFATSKEKLKMMFFLLPVVQLCTCVLAIYPIPQAPLQLYNKPSHGLWHIVELDWSVCSSSFITHLIITWIWKIHSHVVAHKKFTMQFFKGIMVNAFYSFVNCPFIT